MGYYQIHLFWCSQSRPEGHPMGSCAAKGSVELGSYLKEKVKELELPNVRINSAGCLGRCDQGPAMVVYPEGIWYKPESKGDMDEIISSHLQNGKAVARLRLPDAPTPR